jgi:hypothetical protein
MTSDTATKIQLRFGEVSQNTFEKTPEALNFALTHPEPEREGTAGTPIYFRLRVPAGERDTFMEFSQGNGESVMRFALSFIEAVVQDQLKKRARLLEDENSFLRERLANLPVKRKTHFRLPENFWEEETEPV